MKSGAKKMLVSGFVKTKCCRRKFNVYKFVGLDCKAKCVKIWIWYTNLKSVPT